MNDVHSIMEQDAATAFSRQAPVFDALYGGNQIIRYKRARVRAHLSRFLNPECKLLELNCGTGEDAIYFSNQGHQVCATDVSHAMLEELERKASAQPIAGRLTVRQCSFHNLDALGFEHQFDAVFSNFGGLNCTHRLAEVLASCNSLLKPGGTITVVIIPPFCLWESLLLLKGEWRTATRRWFSRRGALAQVEGQSFPCWYYRPVYLRKALSAGYEGLALEGLCTIVPPSYRENFPRRFPRLLRCLQWLEDRLAASWPFRAMGDYFIMTLRKKAVED
ncbi:MAG: class I SAM-dependent methyltransferase [Chitinophagaceae bacterium]|nr:MAG: class I SAM-dependent methyltransferase [Chitinophagaceae bacterium]